MSAPTPRTDAAWNATFDSEQISAGRTARALRECSQQLETELTALTAECDQLRADCENETKWAAHYLAQSIADKARAERLALALKDAISTYDPSRKETLVSAERQEAWIAALREDAK